MKDHLRFACAYWHSFNGDGSDPFGEATHLFPWLGISDPVERAKPKADAASLSQTLSLLPGAAVVALVETVAGFMDLARMCAMPGLARVAFGSIDFGIDSGIEDEGDAMTAVRTALVLQCRAAGLPAPVDGVSVEFRDAAQMGRDALRSRQLGFGGKLCIHPLQVAAVNSAFEPSAEQQAWAQRVLAAFEASGGAATAVDGKMVDQPVFERARRIADSAQQAPT
ncbi:MAG: CoA ester lyase [Comamonadaceae bacterium]|nr:MAG: CoA ester lyase [Comamonadaceae bacterium]